MSEIVQCSAQFDYKWEGSGQLESWWSSARGWGRYDDARAASRPVTKLTTIGVVTVKHS